MILARKMADSMTLKTSLLSSEDEKSAAYVKEAMINVFRDPTERRAVEVGYVLIIELSILHIGELHR